MATFVIAHGAWSAAWAWKKMRPLMAAAGHAFVTPTYTGLGERHHLAKPGITLDTHIADVIGVIETEDLNDITLVGHSYGGMVATGVADEARDRISRLVYLDAFVPETGQSLFDLQAPEHRARAEAMAHQHGRGWLLPPNPPPPDTPEADMSWITPRRHPQPLATFSAPLHLKHGTPAMPRSYIFCTRIAPADSFRRFADTAKADPAWRYFELDASHNPHITVPDQLMAVLEEIVAT